ncbi:DNA-dependent metalloprotease SPRTN [Bufo gargarizans]|uniref:DNA-dependent metalloprotease SPRTN n=1 Tax=Bufo gargarizans TaxID=30331 RepID=UPI001CF217C2|nr:DNA-dependent metalloprotease SPRTN [Bufo gargarizans]
MMDADLVLAIQLQEQYNREEAGEKRRGQASRPSASSAQPPLTAVVDPSWELLDPSPNIHELFLQFNEMFFWGKLVGVEVKWSPRMTLCAGVCSYEGRGGLCSIRLSKPLLMLRPRKDLVETLLHEMIHALLFVTDNNKDHDGHGPEFHKHMNRINGLTGSKISVFHSFHDEVEEYRKHWWRCNGPCQNRPPYYGYVKRAMNRAPSRLDPWWAEHQRSCGGTFIKVKEPEKKTGKDKKKEDPSEVQPSNSPEVKGKAHGPDIRSFFPFSGTGYRLGAPSQTSILVNVHSVPSSSSKALSSSPVKPVQTTSALSSLTNKSMNPRPNLPKVSVANTKAFKQINGSPVRIPVKDWNTSKPSGSKLGTLDGFTQKRLSFALPTSSQGAPPTSQGSSHDQSQDRPPKRPRLDTKTLNDNFSGGNSFKEEPVIVLDGGPSSNPTASNSSQSKMVNCPVCAAKVLETKINEHLDNCLNS